MTVLIGNIIVVVVLGMFILDVVMLKSFKKQVEEYQNELGGMKKTVSNFIAKEMERKSAHSKAFERLTDPMAIMEEMERGADLLEARQANRLTMPRPDAGPPAKVHRPKLRSKLPSSWRPPKA